MNTQYKTKLEEEKKTLTAELGSLGKHNPENNSWEATPETASPAETADDNSNADRFEDYEEKTATIAPLTARLAQVDGALARLENGSFGKCSVCGNAIEDARLEANPAAETCMAHLEN
jgi:RNA polymerase-binding transcription factor DksA